MNKYEKLNQERRLEHKKKRVAAYAGAIIGTIPREHKEGGTDTL